MTAGSTVGPGVELLADHSVWLALPALAPAFVVSGVVVYIAVRNRRKGEAPHSEASGRADQDGDRDIA
jgi:hypothetical protein